MYLLNVDVPGKLYGVWIWRTYSDSAKNNVSWRAWQQMFAKSFALNRLHQLQIAWHAGLYV